MASFNRVVIMGNLGQDPELRYTQNQNAVTTLNIATTEYSRTPEGERTSTTEWHRVVVWGKNAENCSKYLRKGSSVYIEGKLQTRSWEDKQGQKRYTTEIVAQITQFLSRREDNAGGGYQAQDQSQGGSGYDDFNPPSYGAPAAGGSNQASSPGFVDDASLDDIPF